MDEFLPQDQSLAALGDRYIWVFTAAAETTKTRKPGFTSSNQLSTTGCSFCESQQLSTPGDVLESLPCVHYILLQRNDKINNKMGNIQIKEKPKRTHTIFGKTNTSRSRSKSPFREAIRTNSPYYQNLSPIRYSPLNRIERKTELKDRPSSELSFQKSEEKYFRNKPRHYEKSPIKLQQEINQNKQKCEDIIKKVRNFNDFLSQLKRKLRQDCKLTNNTHHNQSQISMSLKLQNQKLQLEKYKKLVQRQLSKTHSIESIVIQSTPHGQKILTIQYQQGVIEERPQKMKPIRRHNEIQYQKKLQFEQTTELRKPSHGIELAEAKKLLSILKLRCSQLSGLLVQEEENCTRLANDEPNMFFSKAMNVNVKTLLMNLEETNKQSKQIQKQISSLFLI